MKPFEPSVDYTKVHNALYQLYTKLPDFKADHIVMYTVLMSYYNESQGYAFPTKAELALRLNCGINKPTGLAKVLEKYGLIRCVPRHKAHVGSNDIYYVFAPITSAQEFAAKYPIESAEYDERARRLLERNIKAEADEVIESLPQETDELSDWL
jgi:hypothetical protein